MWHTIKTQHYHFHFKPDSYAARHLQEVVDTQEKCFREITGALKVSPKGPIKYFLLDTAEEVGCCYGDHIPCNGFARLPNEIYAVYSEDVKCIGHHEDAHIISYMTLNRPPSNFIREGLAMYFDKTWHGHGNEKWVKHCHEQEMLPDLKQLMNNQVFHTFGENITYPLSGAFTAFLIEEYGMDKYIDYYRQLEDHPLMHLQTHYSTGVDELTRRFLNRLEHIQVTEDEKHTMKEKGL